MIVCAVFFALGYTLGRKSDAALAAAGSSAADRRIQRHQARRFGIRQPAPPMTFYKAVEQKDANSAVDPGTTSAESNSPAAPAASRHFRGHCAAGANH